MFDNELRMFKNTLQMFRDTSIVLETNKKIIVQCPDDIEARGLCRTLRSDGYTVAMKKGLKTDHYYVAVY